jgi:two-component system LytT family response regulator
MITTIIIDDETPARNNLRLLLNKYCPEVNVINEYSSADEAFAGIIQHKPDLIFLDIEMPNKSGFELIKELRSVGSTVKIIFVTAYDHYAIKALRYSAIDYLLKPIEVSDLIFAVGRVRVTSDQNTRLTYLLENLQTKDHSSQKLMVPDREGMHFIELSGISYCLADGNYTYITLKNGKKIHSSKTLKEFEDLLPDSLFFRIHNSTIINLNLVKKFIKGDGGFVQLEDDSIHEVSRRKKQELLQRLAGNSIS